jgi:archaeosine-15-forming tRNA-guanine transglycosylase
VKLEDRIAVVFHGSSGPWRESAGSLISKIVRNWPQITPFVYTPIGLIPFQLEDLNPFAHILGPSVLWDAAAAEFEDLSEVEDSLIPLAEELLNSDLEGLVVHNLHDEDEDLLARLENLLGEGTTSSEGTRGDVRHHHQLYAICDKIVLFTNLEYEVVHSIAENLTFVMSRTRRVNNVLLNGVHLFSQRLTDGGLSLTTEGAKWIHDRMDDDIECGGLPRVVIDSDAEPFVRDGRNVMHGFIIGHEGLLRTGMPCLVVNQQDDLVAYGIAQCGERELLTFRKGIAVKIRGGINLS